MKITFSLLLLICLPFFVQAQKLSSKKTAAIKSLNEKAKEAVGNIRLFKGAKKRLTIEDASFTATAMGVKITVVIGEVGDYNTTFTSEFNPVDIKDIVDQELAKESPVGQLKINLDHKLGLKTWDHKKQGYHETYEDAVNFNYLKVDKNNFDEIEDALLELKEIYEEESYEPLLPLANAMNRTKEFWVSSNGLSNTYELSLVYVTGCTMRIFYHLQSIGVAASEGKQTYLTVVALDDIADVKLDKSKSKPNCILLLSGKKGFATYEFVEKGKKYEPTKAVKEIPLFIDVTYDYKRDQVMEMLKTLVKQCGGGKIKL